MDASVGRAIGGKEKVGRRAVTCIVTIHGIGFQQPPDDERGIRGYADDLHIALKQALPSGYLGDDPYRNVSGAVYVESDPSGFNDREEGLKRLGRLRPDGSVDPTGADLVEDGVDRPRFAHVALVYSNSEDWRHLHLGSAADGLIRSVVASGRYLSILTSLPWLLGIIAGLRLGQRTAVASLQRRGDLKSKPTGGNSGLGVVLWGLANDVCAYVCENDLRSRVRGFAWEVLYRLASRDDVEAVIVNAHSQGTVVALDALRGLEPSLASKVRGLITAGSPLRKYVDLFAWGDRVGPSRCLPWIRAWCNFWDPADPVADPLRPSARWKAGARSVVAPSASSLFKSVDPDGGDPTSVNVIDVKVANTKYARGGGLQAHNYWDNSHDFIPAAKTFLLGFAPSMPAGVRVVALDSPGVSRSNSADHGNGRETMSTESNGNNSDTVRFPGNPSDPTATDLSAPITRLLHELKILATDQEYDQAGTFTTPPQSVAIIEANATALSKLWTSLLAAGGGATAVFATIQGVWGGETAVVRVAFVVGAAVVLAAIAIAMGLIVNGDVRGRAAGAVAEYQARAQIASTFLTLSKPAGATASEVSKDAMLVAAALRGNFEVKLSGNSEYKPVTGIRLDPIERLQVRVGDDWVGMHRVDVFKTTDGSGRTRTATNPARTQPSRTNK